MKITHLISISLLILFFFPGKILSAEVLQVKDSSTLQIGDQNRIYKVTIACIAVEPEKEDLAYKWLKSELPRRSRVNLQPIGYNEGYLISKVIKIESNKDISKSMELHGLAVSKCPE